MSSRLTTITTVAGLLLAAACAGTGAGAGSASGANPTAPRGAFYTEAQARRGQQVFRRICTECHYTSEFRGPVFTNAWGRRTARDFYRELRRTMPDDDPGGLEPQLYADVVAYVLELNGYPAGPLELPPDEAALASMSLAPPTGGGD